MSDVVWRSMVEGAQCTTGCTDGVSGILNPAYAAARNSMSKVGGGSSIPHRNGGFDNISKLQP